jgi:hypothetical protein
LRLLADVVSDGGPAELEMADVRAWALLAQYFALKIRAATALQTFRVNGDAEEQVRAVALLEAALDLWIALSEVTDQVYNEVESAKLIWIEEPALLSWKAFIGDARYDIEIAREDIQTMLPRE